MPSTRSSSTASVTASRRPGPLRGLLTAPASRTEPQACWLRLDDSRDAEVLADAIRTDRRCLRELAPLDPIVVELRDLGGLLTAAALQSGRASADARRSRMAEDLCEERNRLGNRVREQLWRYYPQILELAEDVAATWFLELWALLPTPG